MPCMVGFHDPAGFEEIQRYGQELGKDFACVRVYMKPAEWGTVIPRFGAAVVAADKLAVASHKPPASPDAWARLIRGDYDAEIAAIVEAHKNTGRETIFLFNHEPHDNCSDIGRRRDRFRGTSDEYRAAHQYIVDKFQRAEATNVRFGYCGTDPGIFATPDLCYPGHEYVDVLCHDLYNWGDHRSERDNWTEFEDPDRWPRAVELAKTAGKPLVIGEFGCHPSAPTYPQPQPVVPQRRLLPAHRPRRQPVLHRVLLLPLPAPGLRLSVPAGPVGTRWRPGLGRRVLPGRLLRLRTAPGSGQLDPVTRQKQEPQGTVSKSWSCLLRREP